jgi:hypothetical protein
MQQRQQTVRSKLKNMKEIYNVTDIKAKRKREKIK